MSNTHRSALGKMIDMAAIRAKNEHARAVGNMNVNARGDVIDSHGNVINDNNKRVNEHYMRSVMNRGPARQVLVPQDKKSEQAPPTMPAADVAPVVPPAPVPAPVPAPAPVVPQFTAEELEFDQEDQLVELPVKEEPPVEKREAPKKISLSKKVDQ